MMPTPSPLGTFSPSGDLWTRLHRNFARLEEEKYWPQNVFQRERAFEKWPGDIEGRTLLAWCMLAQATGREPRYLEETLRRWPSELNERGYFGKDYSPSISEQQLSSHGWVLRGLSELERWRPGGPARELAKPILENLFLPLAGRYGHYPIDPADREAAGSYSGTHHKQIGDWVLSSDIGCYAIGMDGVIDAYDVFRDERLVPLVNEMVDRFLEIDLAPIQAQTHATLTGCRGLMRWAALADRPELVQAVQQRYQLYTELAWTETYANYNWFGRPRWTEPCAVVDSLMVVMELWRHYGDPSYLEHAQLIWFNALGHGQRANGGFGCDNCPGADGSTKLSFSTVESHWCCTMRGSEGLARMTQYQVFEYESTLTLPFLLSGDYQAGGLRLAIESDYPSAAKAALRLSGDVSKIKSLRLYLPPWIENVKASAGRREGEWLVVPIDGPSVVTVEGELAERTRQILPSTVAYIDSRSDAALHRAHELHMRGPLVLAGAARAAQSKNPDQRPALQPIYQAYLDGIMDKEQSARPLLFETSPA